MAALLTGQIDEAAKAQDSATSRASAARKRMMELAGEAAGFAKEYGTIRQELYEPAVKSVTENFGGGDLASKNSTDAAMMSLAKARFAGIQVDGIDQELIMASAAQAAGGSAVSDAMGALRTERDTLTASARTSLIEARDALSGVEGAAAKPLMDAVAKMAESLGVDIAKPVAPAVPASDGAAPDAAAAPADAGTAPTDGQGAPADGSPADGAPAAAPGTDGSAPAEQPATPPEDPAPAQAEPNK
jgi:hypothetical protein